MDVASKSPDSNALDPILGPWFVSCDGMVEGPLDLIPTLRRASQPFARISGFHDMSRAVDGAEFIRLHESSIAAMFEPLWSGSKGKAKQDARITGAAPDMEALDDVLGRIDALCGLERAKRELRESISLIRVSRLRMAAGLDTDLGSFHAVFAGNPGTGKTTFARLYGEALAALGVASSAKLVEAARSDLVAGYVGQTAMKTREIIDRALGGILFIDEAYSLVTNEQDSYGLEALAELIKCMEDQRNSIIVILAGYTEDMEELLSANPGLRSRVLSVIHFDDYEDQDLVSIAEQMAKSRGFELSDASLPKMKDYLASRRNVVSAKDFGNARESRNLVDRMIRSHAMRIGTIPKPTEAELKLLIAEDVP